MPQYEDRSIVILTGAGISKESGLETFRDPDGIWARVSIDEVATPEAFARDPERVHGFSVRWANVAPDDERFLPGARRGRTRPDPLAKSCP